MGAEVGGSELQDAPSRQEVDRIAMLGSVGLCDRINAHLIWGKLKQMHLDAQEYLEPGV